ncbi:MAG: nucleotidyltransferase domain-containing protein [Candidatus Aenigmarchaeota archaeon]|nr:nucleotidyltransferase domain-containing protein [Candidatus Aenigmarchaeota archaeon]
MSEKQRQIDRKAYALSFTSFLLRELKKPSKINSIILYGSVAKSISTDESDVDIFIDVEKETKNLKMEIQYVLERFYKSKEAIIFKTIGIDNEIKLKTSKLDKWEDLKRSIMSEGIVLWGKFESGKPRKTKHMVIFHWDKIEKNRGAFLNKIYGYRTGGILYRGLLSGIDGSKLGKSCIMVPIKYREKVIVLLKKYNVNAKILEVFI